MEEIILIIICIFSLLGALDKAVGNKFGLGNEFDKAFNSMGSLAVAIIGIYSIAPLLAKLLLPIIAPLYKKIGADPSIFISTLLACDMGAYSSAVQIAATDKLVLFSGLILSSMMGATVSFSIPIGIQMIKKEDYRYFAQGIICGIITLPVGCFVGGIMLDIPLKQVIFNLIPIIIISIMLIVGLSFFQDKSIKVFQVFSRIIFIISIVGLVIIIVQVLTDTIIIDGLVPITESIYIVVKISIILSGAYPLVYVISKKFKNQFKKIGERFGINEVSVIGIITSLANSVPVFGMINDMNKKGKVMCVAFSVSGAFTFGGQLGFVASVSKEVVTIFIISKLISGLTALILAYILWRKIEREEY